MSVRAEASVSSRPHGGVVVFLDGGEDIQYTDFVPVAEANGGLLNFALYSDGNSVEAGFGGQMSWAQIVDLTDRGHEIVSMSKSNADMTAMAAADRVPEWDDSRTDLYSYGVPADTITSFVYPNGQHEIALDREAYLRYDRVFAGSSAPYVMPRASRDRGIAFGRATWAEDDYYHQRALQLLRRAAAEDVIVTLVAHTNGVTGESPTLAQFTEFCELAAELGVPMMSTSEAFPAYTTIPDAGFEDSNLINWEKNLAGGATIVSATHTPLVGFTGTRSLSILGGDDVSNPHVLARHPIPITSAETITFSAHVKQAEVTSHGGLAYDYGGYIFIKEYDQYGTQIGANISSPFIPSLASTAWEQLTVAYTPNSNARTFRLGCGQYALADYTYFDHLHIGPARFGVLG